MPPGGVTKKVHVQLTSCHIPLKRKYILIKEGKQLLMLKALGDSRSVYSIEEKGVARRGITRSGKRHFQFSLPKFVNALEGMNNHNQHQNVTAKYPQSQTAQKPKKGHFAKKSTGNNIKHAIQLKNEQKKQQLSSQDDQSCTKNVKLDSIADIGHLDSTPKRYESKTQAETLKDQKSSREDQKDPKGPSVSTRSSKQKQTLGSLSGKADKNGEQKHANPTDHDDVSTKLPKFEGKENGRRSVNFNKDEKTCPLPKNGKTKGDLNLQSKDSLKTATDKESSLVSSQSLQDTQKSSEKPSELLNTKLDNETSSPHLDFKEHPKEVLETVKKKERASTPTPEPPGKKNVVNKLSRKRHRSASPKVCSSDVESSRDSAAKPQKEPIKLHTKNFEKVKNACKNAISQRKDKTASKADVENIASVSSETSPKTNDECVSDDSRPHSEKDKQLSPDKNEPATKKAKVSSTGDAKETAKSSAESSKTSGSHPHTDSDDGLARLMKDFQSAIVANTCQKNTQEGTPKHKYISKKTSHHAIVAKSQKNSCHMQKERKEKPDKSVLQKPSHKLKELVPIPTEPVSSDEECEHPNTDAESKKLQHSVFQVTEKHSEKDSKSLKEQECKDAVKPTIKIPELKTASSLSPDKLVVVDEIGFPTTAESSNSSDSIFNNSESGKAHSNKTLESISPSHSGGESCQLSEGGVALGEGGLYTAETDKVQELNQTTKNEIPEKDALKTDNLNGNSYVAHWKDSNRSNLKRDYERDDRHGVEKKPKIDDELPSVTLKSRYTQTDEVVVSKEDKSIATEVSGKSDVKHQATQFDSERSDFDTEEISRIVAAVYESECEEKERLTKALQVQKEREDKWRKIAQEYAKQLQELKNRLECKGNESKEQGTNTSEGSSSTALPVIISSQSTQTGRIRTGSTPIMIPAEDKKISSAPGVPSKPVSTLTAEKKDPPKSMPSSTAVGRLESATSVATTSNSVNERKPPVGPSTSNVEVSKQTYAVQNSRNQTPSRTLSAQTANTNIQSEGSSGKPIQQNGVVKPAASDKNARTEGSKDVTVIDLTDTEDINISESTTSTPTRLPVQSRSTVLPGKLVQGSPVNLRKSPVIPSKQNILQLTSKAGTKEQVIENKIKPFTSSSVLTLDKTSTIPKRTQPSSSVQSIQRVVQTNAVQNAGTMKVSPQLPINQLVTMGQPIVTVPPPRLQAAPSIAGNIYTPQSAQVPVFSTIGNIGMIIGNQPQPRQDSAMQGVLQTHGIMQRPILAQGQTSLLVRNSSNLQGNLPIRMPQAPTQLQALSHASAINISSMPAVNLAVKVSTSNNVSQGSNQQSSSGLSSMNIHPNTQLIHSQKKITTDADSQIVQSLKNQKAILEKRHQELKQHLAQCYQRSNNAKVNEISAQLQAVLTELRNIEDKLNAPIQGQRNMRVTQVSAPSNMATQASRLAVAPQYNIGSGTLTPVSTVHQMNPGIQQREVVNGIKPYVPLATRNTTMTNAPNKPPVKTWFPETRQGAESTEKGKGNKFAQHVNQSARSHGHPAKLPVLQHPPSSSTSPLLPPPSIRITHSPEGVVLSWNISVQEDHPTVKKYFLYAYQVLNTPPSTSHWKRIGEVGALAPPMACTLNQFQPGSTYFLAICAVDVYDRPGVFSKMEEVVIPT